MTPGSSFDGPCGGRGGRPPARRLLERLTWAVTVVSVVAGATAFKGGTAWAVPHLSQDGAASVGAFRYLPDYFTDATTRDAPAATIQAVTHYGHAPLMLRDTAGRHMGALIDHQVSVSLQGTVRLLDRLSLYAAFAWVVQREVAPAYDRLGTSGALDVTVGLPLGPYAVHGDDDAGGARGSLMLVPYVTLPTGAADRMLGHGNPAVGLRSAYHLAIDRAWRLAAGLSVGYEPETRFCPGALHVTYATGAHVLFFEERLGFGPEYLGAFVTDGTTYQHAVAAALWLRLGAITARASASYTLAGAATVPLWTADLTVGTTL